MKILITGGSGFIGSHLVNRLVGDNEKVEIIIRPNSNTAIFDEVKEKIVLYEHDGTTENMLSILNSSCPDIVYHLASHSLHQHNAKDIDSLIKSNILFGNQLIEGMLKAKVYHLVNTGTYWQHYQNKDYSPTCLYAATKQAFQNITQFYLETTDLKIITLKLFDTYGPKDPRNKLFNHLRRASENNESLNMSPGDQSIDIVYISDVIEAYVVSARRLLYGASKKSEEFAISNGASISLKDLVTKYLQISGKNIDIKWGGNQYREREVMIPWDKGNILPGWEPKITLEDGIRYMESI